MSMKCFDGSQSDHFTMKSAIEQFHGGSRCPQWFHSGLISCALHGIIFAVLFSAQAVQPKSTNHPPEFIGVSLIAPRPVMKPILHNHNEEADTEPVQRPNEFVRPPVRTLNIPSVEPLPTGSMPVIKQQAAELQTLQEAVVAQPEKAASAQSSLPSVPDRQAHAKASSELLEKVEVRRRLLLEAQKKQQQLDWLSMFPSQVAATIQAELPNEVSALGMQCELKIQLTSDGTLINVSDASGDETLCVAAKNVLFRIGRFEIPENIPDSANALKDLTINIR